MRKSCRTLKVLLTILTMQTRYFTILLFALISTCSFAFGSPKWDAYLDFWSKAATFPGTTTPNTWSYGSAPSAEKDSAFSFVAFTDNNLELEIPTGGPLFKHANPGSPDPCVARANAAWYGDAPPMPPYLFVHPGENSFAIVRWKAPKAGTYKVRATFLASGASGLKTVGIVRYKESGAKEEVMRPALIDRQNSKAEQAKYDGSLKLETGEFVAFYVGNGGDGHASDAVGLDAVIVAE